MDEKEYQQLMSTSTKLDSKMLELRKYKIWEYFRNLGVQVYNLEKNVQSNISIYIADVQNIHGSRMANVGYSNGNSEIFLDKSFYSDQNNQHIVSCQITHELLHSLSRLIRNGQHFYMGHADRNYGPMEEATTQMFAESIDGQQLSPSEDYLYFIKNIMRIIKIIVGEQRVASQFLNNDVSLENEIIRLTNDPNWFETFANEIKKSYSLSKSNTYNNLNEIELLNITNNKIISTIQVLINAKQKENPDILQEISVEFGKTPPDFLSVLGIDVNSIKI